jgi:hypothetical protein
LGELLKPDLSAYLFAPADAEAERRAQLHALRTTPYGRDYTTTLTIPGQPTSNQQAKAFGAPGAGGVFSPPNQGFVDIPAFQQDVTIPVNVFDDTVFDPIEQADFILFDNPLYRRSQQSHTAFVRILDSTDTLRINFQTPEVIPTGGYRPDTGKVFGDRGSGLKFGWDADNTANARVRNNPGSPDFRYDTYNHMQKDGGDRKWELEVPNGMYEVRLVAGDPSATDSDYRMSLEGQPVLSGTPTGDVRWFRRTFNVEVKDGRLSLGNAAGAMNNKIAFLDVRLADVGRIAGPVTDNIAVHLVTPATLPQWHRTPSGLFADNQIDEPLWT